MLSKYLFAYWLCKYIVLHVPTNETLGYKISENQKDLDMGTCGKKKNTSNLLSEKSITFSKAMLKTLRKFTFF